MSLLLAILRLLPRTRTHHRCNGPVTINPDTRETIHVYGTPHTSDAQPEGDNR